MSSTVYCMVIVILLFCPETGGISITWKEPLPIQAISDDNQIHSSYTQLLEGTINATLSWLFSLSSDLTFSGVNLRFNGEVIGAVEQSGDVVVASGFEDKFDLRWIPYERVILFVFNVTTEVNGTFGCDVLAKKVGTLTFKSTTQVDVVDPPSNIATSGDQTVSVSDELTLNCSADGKPKPTITWTRLSDNTIVTMPFNISSRQYGGYYRCTADNGVGNPLRKNVFINVLFPPIITIESKFFVGRGQTASINCEVEGNPTPSIRWIPCDLQNIVCDKQYLNISKVLTSRAHYTCTASNSEGSDLETTLLIIGGKDIFLRISTSGECDKKDHVWETLQSELAKVFANTQNYIGAELIADIRCGSLTFDVNLKFNTRVAEDVIISTIRNAILHKRLGELRINVSSIIGIPPVPLPTTTKPLKTTPKPESDDTWDIVGAVLGAVAFVVIVAVIIWCVRRKKYCSKETKEFSSTNVSGQGRGHGEQGQNGDDESHGSTSVLRPFNTPGNRDKEDAGQAMALHVYAEVDKSNKKPRAETGGARQSGELQYLQIDHSNNEGSLPRKSSSEPMIAPSFQETVYADLV